MERARQADAHARKALELLHRPVLKEFFANPTNVRHLRSTDHDLDALRPRPDFQEFAAGLGPK